MSPETPEPAGASARHAFLESRLREACGRDDLLLPGSLRVSVAGDTLLITGLAQTAAKRTRVTEIAHSLAPDLTVDNACVVDGQEALADTDLKERIADWLRRHFGAEAVHLGVRVGAGRVHLRGTWPTLSAVEQARDTIASLPGVRAVDSAGVTLRHGMSLPDAGVMPLDGISVVNALETRLARAGYRLGDWVDAHNDHGTLELVGLVDDEACRRQVVAIAAGLSGVRRVVDRLVTRSGSRDADAAVERRIRQAWAASSAPVAPPNLHLAVVGDRAFVRGSEDTPEARDAAIAIVRADPAIRRVVDRIDVRTHRLA